MLPSRPNNASKVGAGLRSAPRSRSVGRPSHEYEREQLRTQAPPSSVRTLRPQRSAANLPSHSDRGRDASSRRTAPPVPSNPRARSQAPSDRRRERYYDDQASYSYKSGTESISSRSSVSSSGSSFLDRMKGRSGYASSRTSLEEDADSYSPKQGRQFDGRQAVRRDVANDGSEDEQQSDYGFQQTGFGSSLWSRVAGAAGSLTVNVSKAWAANITTFSGEETPPGQESRLTRAMKAYHLEKARDPSDLPGWLFSEQERRSRPSRHESPLDRQLYEEVDTTVPPRSRGLKDIYAAAATSTLSGYGDRSEASSGRRFAGQAQQPPSSKATDRLKAMRDAKRGAMARHDADDGHPPVSSFGREGYGHRMEEERRSPRMGLPSGPGLRSRRG